MLCTCSRRNRTKCHLPNLITHSNRPRRCQCLNRVPSLLVSPLHRVCSRFICPNITFRPCRVACSTYPLTQWSREHTRAQSKAVFRPSTPVVCTRALLLLTGSPTTRKCRFREYHHRSTPLLALMQHLPPSTSSHHLHHLRSIIMTGPET